MIKIESATLEEAYTNAAATLECSVTELHVEVVQFPSKGVLGLFKKRAIIVAAKKHPSEINTPKQENSPKPSKEESLQPQQAPAVTPPPTKKTETSASPSKAKEKTASHAVLGDTIMPQSFVSMQDEDEDTYYEPVYADEQEDEAELDISIEEIAKEVKEDVNALFKTICFDIDEIEVGIYDANTLLMEFKGEDAALLIGKEGYRYKALSYMLFNWINTKYQVGLRLEIAEFLKNQEEAVSKYLESVSEIVAKEGRAQTKILDGVLVQIALKELREMYPEKYVAIRSTRDGLKYIIVNDYHAK
ncbi:MAG: Jag N-terminal domain-containing protein [Sulfurimonadaceae bacterium]